ncbi:MAG: AraD1 family protein [Geminicoccaceae bacterium]
MRLVQFISSAGGRRVGRVAAGGIVEALGDVRSVYELARHAARGPHALTELAARAASDERIELAELQAAGRLLAPLDHPDPAHCLVTGTGLTHLGSAQARDSMHQAMQKAEAELTDSMRMFKLGLDGGKPEGEAPGVAPEWFYKGDGSIVAAPGQPLTMPGFALDGGEEAEIAMLYLIDDAGRPRRVGYALGNEFSDHVLERRNYLYLAHSKLRPCAFGPELLLGDLPAEVRGTIRVLRAGQAIWQAEFLSGETNMSHTLANLEHHHFKYAAFRRPGDVHVHFIGAATLSFTAGVRAEPGDVFEIDVPTFGAPLRNALAIAEPEAMVRVEPL